MCSFSNCFASDYSPIWQKLLLTACIQRLRQWKDNTVHAAWHAPRSKSPPQPFMQLEKLGWRSAKASALPCAGSTAQLVLLGQNLEHTELIVSLLYSYGLNLPLQSKTLPKSPPLGVFLYGSLHSHSYYYYYYCYVLSLCFDCKGQIFTWDAALSWLVDSLLYPTRPEHS